MQADKAFLELGGRTLLDRTLELARTVAENVTLSSTGLPAVPSGAPVSVAVVPRV